MQNSYASVLKTGIHNDMNSGVIKENKIILSDDECVNSNPYKFAVAGCVKEFKTLPNLRSLCDGEGFPDVTLRYLGGFWVLCQFKKEETRDQFLKHKGVNTWFHNLHEWVGEFDDIYRVVWLDIEGLSPFLWTDNTFSKIAQKWGSLVYVDDSTANNLYGLRLCIKTKIKKSYYGSM